MSTIAPVPTHTDLNRLTQEGLLPRPDGLQGLIGNLPTAVQREISTEVHRGELRTSIDATMSEGGLSRLVQSPTSVLLSREFALDALTQLYRGAIGREEAGEIFQLTSALEATRRLQHATVTVLPCDPSDPTGPFMRKFGRNLSDEALADFTEQLNSLPPDRRVLISFIPGFSSENYEAEREDRLSLQTISDSLLGIGETWISQDGGWVSSVTLMPLGVQNCYCRARFGENNLVLVPEFGVSSPEVLEAELLRGEQGVMVGNPFQPDETAHSQISTSLALHIHDYYHHVNRCQLPTETRTHLLALREQLRQNMADFAITNAVSTGDNAPVRLSENEIAVATHVVDLARNTLLDMERFFREKDMSAILKKVVSTVDFTVPWDPVVNAHCNGYELVDFRTLDLMQHLSNTPEYAHLRPLACAQMIIERTALGFTADRIQSPFPS